MRVDALQNAEKFLTSESRGIVLGFLFFPHAHLASVFYTGAPKRKSPRTAQAWLFRPAAIAGLVGRVKSKPGIRAPAPARRIYAGFSRPASG